MKNKSISNFFENTDFEYLNVGKEIEEKYVKIWEDVYKPSQDKKIIENNIDEDTKNKAFNGLSKRGKFLCDLATFFDVKNIAEVGTAEGYQFYSFSLNENFKVYTCDVRDVRNKDYKNKFKNSDFTLGNSKEMSKKILEDNNEIDMFWIDGAHHGSAVLYDVIALAKTASKNAIWVFDDFNERFGAFNEINFIKSMGDESYVLSLGPTASGKPNNMLILRGL
tara:strand:+ start:214 stop:879 length:666 start_codon:yes stop_codon:yes gene_type:complete